MSKYPDLVNRLRTVTVKPVPRQRSTVGINPRYDEPNIWPEHILNNPDGPAAADAIEHLMSEIDFLDEHWRMNKKRIAELETALKPFVPEADINEEEYTSVWNHHLIQARKILEGK